MLKYRIFTWANLVTFSGIIAIGLSLLAFYYQHFAWGLGLYIYAAVTDFADGKIAKKLEALGKAGISPLGKILDPIRDKLLILILVFVNWQLMIIALALELVSIIFSTLARHRAGYHIITEISRKITVAQCVVIGVLIIFPQFCWLFIGIYSLTITRIWSYMQKI